MQVDRLSITMEATADRVRNEALGHALDQWEAEDGTFNSQELTAAAQALGLVRKRSSRRK